MCQNTQSRASPQGLFLTARIRKSVRSIGREFAKKRHTGNPRFHVNCGLTVVIKRICCVMQRFQLMPEKDNFESI